MNNRDGTMVGVSYIFNTFLVTVANSKLLANYKQMHPLVVVELSEESVQKLTIAVETCANAMPISTRYFLQTLCTQTGIPDLLLIFVEIGSI